MLFNRGAFNKSFFNRTQVVQPEPSALYGSAGLRFVSSVAPGGYKLNLPLRGSASLSFSAVAALDFSKPLTGSAGISFGAAAQALRIRILLSGTSGIIFGVSGQLLNTHAYSLTMSGLSLPPGGTVVVDMDNLDVFVDGVYNVAVYESGEFFKLQPGENEIEIYSDGGAGEASVEWESRWY